MACKKINDAGFEVLMVVKVQFKAFWVMTLCSAHGITTQ
jgi:hypothetical protein